MSETTDRWGYVINHIETTMNLNTGQNVIGRGTPLYMFHTLEACYEFLDHYVTINPQLTPEEEDSLPDSPPWFKKYELYDGLGGLEGWVEVEKVRIMDECRPA